VSASPWKSSVGGIFASRCCCGGTVSCQATLHRV
jgi:hypothetical protein